jgi:hypothetical protein
MGGDPSSIDCLIGCDPRSGVRFRRKTVQSFSGAVRRDNLDVEAVLRGLRDNSDAAVRQFSNARSPTSGLNRVPVPMNVARGAILVGRAPVRIVMAGHRCVDTFSGASAKARAEKLAAERGRRSLQRRRHLHEGDGFG